jgi:hypothetical protein
MPMMLAQFIWDPSLLANMPALTIVHFSNSALPLEMVVLFFISAPTAMMTLTTHCRSISVAALSSLLKMMNKYHQMLLLET